MMSFQEFKQSMFDRIKKDVSDDGGLEPFVWMYSNTELNVVSMPLRGEPMDTENEKLRLRTMMKLAAEEFKAEMLCFASEAWVSLQSINPSNEYIAAGQDPMRQEVVFVHFECKNIVYIQETFIIPFDNTDPKNKKLIIPDNLRSGGDYKGWQSGILKEQDYSMTGY